jgi:hypothetical protein
MKILRKLLLLNLSLLIGFYNSFYAQKSFSNNLQSINSNTNLISKKGGIAFRIDDNYKKEYYNKLDSLFNYYNTTYSRDYHFSVALNYAGSYLIGSTLISFHDPDYIAAVKSWQNAGHEIMDHTPNHRTNYFITNFDSMKYVDADNSIPILGVDHIKKLSANQYKICLEFLPPDTTDYLSKGICDVKKDTLYGSFSNIQYDTDIYIYFPSISKIVFISNFNKSKTKIWIQDLWEDNIDLGTLTKINYYNLGRAHKITINAIKVLAQEMQDLAQLYGIEKPHTWIQPGGRHPIISMAELSEALLPLGYTAGASFGEVQSLKVYSEYNPYDFKKFGMQWEDFNEDKKDSKGGSLNNIKHKIADGLAKHQILFGHNHFYDLGSGDYVSTSEYFAKVDSLLAWCNRNNIDIKTYSQWANELYEQISNPYENIFPPLSKHLNNSSNYYTPPGQAPDGYELRWWSDHGICEIDSTAPDSSNYCYSADSWNSRIFLIQKLGGFEKGENVFEIWTKGYANDKISVTFTNPNTNNIIGQFIIPANTSNWTKYSLLNSINGNTTLNLPFDLSLINIELKVVFHNPDNNPLKVSGMVLYKKTPTLSANLKVFLEGPYQNGGMTTSSSFTNSIPQNQPFTASPWDYHGLESFSTLPTNVNVIDWVLVELRSSTSKNSLILQKAGFVTSDGSVVNIDGSPISFEVREGDYYVVIYQRNHLPVMSATPVTFQ